MGREGETGEGGGCAPSRACACVCACMYAPTGRPRLLRQRHSKLLTGFLRQYASHTKTAPGARRALDGKTHCQTARTPWRAALARYNASWPCALSARGGKCYTAAMKDWKTYALILLTTWCAYLSWRVTPAMIYRANEYQTTCRKDVYWWFGEDCNRIDDSLRNPPSKCHFRNKDGVKLEAGKDVGLLGRPLTRKTTSPRSSGAPKAPRP